MTDQPHQVVDQISFTSLIPEWGARSPYMDHQLIDSRLRALDEGLMDIAKRIAGGIGKAAAFVGRKITGRPAKPAAKKSRNLMSPRGGHNVKLGDSCPTPRTKTSVDGSPKDAKRCNDQTIGRRHHY